MDAVVWEKLYSSASRPETIPVLTGFNANIDRVIPVTPKLLAALCLQNGPGFAELKRRLLHSMKYSVADEMVICRPRIYHAISRFFARRGKPVPGGQAGIAAARLQIRGFGPVTCAVPGAGKRTRALLERSGVTPCTFGEGPVRDPDPIHFVLEHSPGLVPPAPGTVPRSNRLIVSPAHKPSSIFIPAAAQDAFLAQIAFCRRAFLSGYQYLHTEDEFSRAARQLAQIRALHPAMRTHIECTGGIHPRIYALIARHVFPHADSIGLNEQELGIAIRALAVRETTRPDNSPVHPVALVRGAVTLACATGISRLHLHTFGYYILIQKPGTGQPRASRDALFLAAREAADAAGGDRRVISPDGLAAYTAIRRAFGPDRPKGIFRTGDRTVIVVPACISLPAKRTTGLGDIISSTAFVTDPF